MHLSGVVPLLLLLLPNITTHSISRESIYLLTVTSQAEGGTRETVCVTVEPRNLVALEVTLEDDQKNITLLTESSIVQEYYKCVPFQVPVESVASGVVSIHIQIKDGTKIQNKTAKILVTPPTRLVLIETDKPIYKPGQTVKFRIVSLDTNFFTYNQMFPTIELRDPNSNRIGQWLNVSTNSGLLDLSYPINSAASNGYYIIVAWNENLNEITKFFEVKDYVLPTFEVKVQLPSVITILDKVTTLKVCANYTYGRPVNGTVRASVCHNTIRYWWFMPSDSQTSDICKNYTLQTDKTGCGQQVLNLKEYALADSRYESVITVQSEVEEYGTGVIMSGSGSSLITSSIVTLSFGNSPTVFKPGIEYQGQVLVTDPNYNPLKKKPVYLTVSYGNNKNSVQNLVTNDQGVARFSLNTNPWGAEPVSLKVQYLKVEKPVTYKNNLLTPYYPTIYLELQPFYSRSRSFITLQSTPRPFSCDQSAHVEAQYWIRDRSLTSTQQVNRAMSFFYMVMSRGHLVQQGRLWVPFKLGQEIKGNVMLSLKDLDKLTPMAQVVVYTILPSGETVADSMNFPVLPCLNNKVSLNFSSSSELPGGKTSLTLKAAPGSLCSVRAIDQSLLLLQPENQLNIQSVFDMLPVQMLSGYPYSIYDEDSDPCSGSQPRFFSRRKIFSDYFPYSGTANVYNVFKDVGIKILTNADIKNTSACFTGIEPIAIMQPLVLAQKTFSTSNFPSQPVATVRTYFPETWIWDLISVSESGVEDLQDTVPDSITTWQADAFCTSPDGFGVAPSAELIGFQPFFVSLTMPSSVIRGEVFTLKATVFNYLQSCMMVEVILAPSKQFSVEKCNKCNYTSCLCADQSWTFSWTIKPLVLGEVSINVTAAAVNGKACGKRVITVPKKGRSDTIIKTLLVKPEGTTRYESNNELLCPSESAVTLPVSLNLPRVIVDGSATASFSVLGDLMGRALQNLASLLAMPYGCGEQNMMLFAPNIFILEYLESTNQLTPAIRSTAENYLVNGYQRELTYKHLDGSYSAFGMSDASGNTWLTAFVMKSFGKAQKYIFVDEMVVDQAKAWLGWVQQDDGRFVSVGQLIHTNMEGGVNDEVTLTAYIASAMLELNFTLTDPVVNKSLAYLTEAYPQVNSTYTKALLFYTFTLAGDEEMRTTLVKDLNANAIVSGGGRHWSRVNDGSVMDSLEVEMTAYVLLSLMSGPLLPGFDLGYSSSIVHWLSQQQNAFGGFESTQDTVVALQALAKYSLATYSPQGAVTVTVTSPSGLKNTFNVTQSNRLLYQESQLQEVPGNYSVSAEGQGCVYVQFTLQYNIPPPPDQSSFSISASVSGNCLVPIPSLEVTINVMYKGQRPQTNMVVMELRPLSGFVADETSVQLASDNSNSTYGTVKRVDQTEGNVIIYLDGLTREQENVYTLNIVQQNKVEKLKPAVVKVYDYYETGDVAVTEYTSPCLVFSES
ncbi:alpha-2-macroglobulin-like [Clarias gariepinus]